MLEAAIFCLAINVFYESGAEPAEGQLLVAHATYNRAEHNQKNVCSVVAAREQFSWVNKVKNRDERQRIQFVKKSAQRLASSKDLALRTAWKRSVAIAVGVLSNELTHPFQDVVSFHESTRRPLWRHKMTYVGKIGNHYFYKPKEPQQSNVET